MEQKMNYKKDLSEQNQKLLSNIDIDVEDREYSTEEIGRNINDISNYIISRSSKNGDLDKTRIEYMPLANILQSSIRMEK